MQALNSFTQHYQTTMGWLAVVSLLTFITSLLLIPFIVGKLPVDIFERLDSRTAKKSPQITLYRVLLILFKNILALFLISCGIVMLFIPGQGLLTILLGFLLLSFPGKQKILIQLIYRPNIQKSLDWIRTKQNIRPFIWPQ